ncbi:MAG: DUF6512 family protein [Halanaerobiales bacterium]
MKKDKEVFNWEVAGFFWIIIVGSLLHFTYEWSGQNPIVGTVSAVNESVWEHLKLGYWSLFFFMLIENRYLKGRVKSFFLAKLSGIIAMELFIIIFFYTYTAILGDTILWLDIGSYIVGAFLCQLISFVLINRKVSGIINNLSLALFIVLGVLFVVFTFYPPDLPIFKE